MFRKILIANRGEIAVTIIRACREMGIQTVAVCSEADKTALHAQMADECICIGPAAASDSYLNAQAILTACTITGAEAIHPGFGFLSENAAFARMCEKCGITFIGPTDQVISQMGDKATARRLRLKPASRSFPAQPASSTVCTDALRAGQEIGYPVMIKASSGGGGRGMRMARTARRTAGRVPDRPGGSPGLLWRRSRISGAICRKSAPHRNPAAGRPVWPCHPSGRPRLLDPAPQPENSRGSRFALSAMTACASAWAQAAVRLAESVGYRGVGTIEFLVDADRNFYFMEMNTRIQVEHPVTEAVTGVNLIQEQIKSAAGLPLEIRQEDIHFSGHAIECRINAEDPAHGFRPSPGTITQPAFPGRRRRPGRQRPLSGLDHTAVL